MRGAVASPPPRAAVAAGPVVRPNLRAAGFLAPNTEVRGSFPSTFREGSPKALGRPRHSTPRGCSTTTNGGRIGWAWNSASTGR